MKKTLLNTLALATLFFASTANAQVGVGVPAGDIHPSAELEVKSTTKGFLPPRMTNAERNSIATPATGLLIYQTDAVANNPAGLYFYDGISWKNGIGAQGEVGPKGDKGETGAQGLQGANGLPGDAGPKGDAGLNGLPGAAGSKGDKGDRGETGLTGAAGAIGPKGDRGETGATGPAGATGAIGPKGDQGPAGISFGTDGQPLHYIGESYGGGTVFFVYDNGQHGLIAAPTDQSTSIKWWNGTGRYTGSKGDGLRAGEMNTAMIVAAQVPDNQTSNFAARVCADYSVSSGGITYGDWYLPSKYELGLLYQNRDKVPNLASAVYWSSTEFNQIVAWYIDFSNGNVDYNDFNKSAANYYVRAIRSFQSFAKKNNFFKTKQLSLN